MTTKPDRRRHSGNGNTRRLHGNGCNPARNPQCRRVLSHTFCCAGPLCYTWSGHDRLRASKDSPPQGGWSASFVRGGSRPPHGQPGVCEQRDAIEIHDGSGEGAVATFIRTVRHLAPALAFASGRARVEGAIVATDD